MKQLITRYYYTLEELFNTSDKYENQLTGPLGALVVIQEPIMQFLYELLDEQGEAATADEHVNTLFNQYIYPRFYAFVIGYIDKENETEPNNQDIRKDAQKWLGRVIAWLNSTKDTYAKLIELYETHSNELMNKLSSETTSLFNDTPQDGGDFTTDKHLTNVAKTLISNDAGTPMARLVEIRKHLENLYEAWSDEFRKFIIFMEE